MGAPKSCCYDAGFSPTSFAVPRFHLAQLNIAQMNFASDDPALADFVARLEAVNALDEAGQRLEHSRRHGPSVFAFSFKQSLPPG